ncbi:uncharacterized protein LOC142198488 [Leptodactylus fuscus]|uniref:uncharacterized protein LOC142198488 n=1 Tax=Leptodactylus fuscus TaxID=238119 RepID=UPI003F4E63B3
MYNTWLSSLTKYKERMDEPQYYGAVGGENRVTSAHYRQLLDLSDELLLLILDLLDPLSLISVSGVCSTLYRVSNTDSLWAKHCRVVFGFDFKNGCADFTPKEAFKLLYMWKTFYGSLPYNRQFQDLLFSRFPPKKYWVQWLSLEEIVPLPPIQLPDHEIEEIWGITKEQLDEKHKVTDETTEVVHNSKYMYQWKELRKLALVHHKGHSNVQLYVLKRMSSECHENLEKFYYQYKKNRFQWLFSYWLHSHSRSFSKQLQEIYLLWQCYDKQKISQWGSTDCDKYLASLHSITDDFWNGKLANGDENLGIQSVDNYFSMCRSLLAWILGRKWGTLKQKKVYHDTLKGVYRMMKHDLQVSVIDHNQFWIAAKIQMTRVSSLEKIAGNYVNWKMIDVLPCYRLFMDTGEPFYLQQIQDILFRKRLISNWIRQEENSWVCSFLPQSLLLLLEYDTKIYEESLHQETVEAHLSRLIWLYLHSGQQLYVDAMKDIILCAVATMGHNTVCRVHYWS